MSLIGWQRWKRPFQYLRLMLWLCRTGCCPGCVWNAWRGQSKPRPVPMAHCPQSLLKRSLHGSSKHTLQTLGISLKILLLCAQTHYSLKERNRETRQHQWKGLSISPPLQSQPLLQHIIIGPETLFWCRPNSVSKLQHGKNMNGPWQCGDSAAELQRVALCGWPQKGNVLLISIVI